MCFDFVRCVIRIAGEFTGTINMAGDHSESWPRAGSPRSSCVLSLTALLLACLPCPALGQVDSPTILPVSCSRDGTTLPPAASRAVTLSLSLPTLTNGATETGVVGGGGVVECQWTLPAPEDDRTTSIVFQFLITYADPDQCRGDAASTALPVVSMLERTLASDGCAWRYTPIADSCSASPLWRLSAGVGRSLVLRFSAPATAAAAAATTSSNVTLGTYSTFTWLPPACPQEVKVADSSRQSVTFPQHGLVIPRGGGRDPDCTWNFVNPDPDGVLRLTLRVGDPLGDLPFQTGDLCPSNGTSLRITDRTPTLIFHGALSLCPVTSPFDYVSIGSNVTFSFSSHGATGVLPAGGMTLDYSLEPANRTCPARLHLQATDRASVLFKGRNPLSGTDDAPRDCVWAISAPSPDMVVQLTGIDVDHVRCLTSEKSNDTLTLQNGPAIAYCDSDISPVWSSNQTLVLRFSATAGGHGNTFYAGYRAVLKRDHCQGVPTMLSAAGDPRTVSGKGAPPDVQLENYDCRWILRAENADQVVQVTVKSVNNSLNCGIKDGIQGFNGASASWPHGIGPRCPSEGGQGHTKVLTSSGDTLLLRLSGRRGDVTLTYRAVDKNTGRAESVTSSTLLLIVSTALFALLTKDLYHI